MGSTALMWAGGGLLGMSMAKSAAKKQMSSLTSQSGGGVTEVTRPETPEAPISSDTDSSATGSTDNALMEEEREKERQAALLRQQQAREVFTSGLGASGLASTGKKTLLGG